MRLSCYYAALASVRLGQATQRDLPHVIIATSLWGSLEWEMATCLRPSRELHGWGDIWSQSPISQVSMLIKFQNSLIKSKSWTFQQYFGILKKSQLLQNFQTSKFHSFMSFIQDRNSCPLLRSGKVNAVGFSMTPVQPWASLFLLTSTSCYLKELGRGTNSTYILSNLGLSGTLCNWSATDFSSLVDFITNCQLLLVLDLDSHFIGSPQSNLN